MLRCLCAQPHTFLGDFYAADLFPSGRPNDLVRFGVNERTLRSATCSAAANIVHLVALAHLELGRDEKNSTEGNYEIPFDDYCCAGIARNSTGDFDRS